MLFNLKDKEGWLLLLGYPVYVHVPKTGPTCSCCRYRTVEEFTANATVALCFVLHCHLYAILYSRKRETYAFDNCDRLRDMFLVIMELLRRTRVSSFL